MNQVAQTQTDLVPATARLLGERFDAAGVPQTATQFPCKNDMCHGANYASVFVDIPYSLMLFR
jgi:hypothetical protein